VKKIVVLSGGTGGFTVLKGLKNFSDKIEITSIVNVFDSGGSTGILKDEYGILPPGDLRRCLIALAEDDMLRDLFTYRFTNGCLNGHSFGNLFLTALTQISGSDIDAIKKTEKILKIKGEVLPISLDHADVNALLEDGQIIKGETNIDLPKHNGNLRIKKIYLEPEASLYSEAKNKILDADLIIIGPGDLYTSILPLLSVNGVFNVLKETKAKKLYICNLMTKFGETNGFKVSDFVKEVIKYTTLDYVLVNSKLPSKNLLDKYASENSFFVELDRTLGISLISKDILKEQDLIRHDSEKIAEAVLELLK